MEINDLIKAYVKNAYAFFDLVFNFRNGLFTILQIGFDGEKPVGLNEIEA